MESMISAQTATQAQKNRICNVCGGMLSIYDIDQQACIGGVRKRRLADHFSGKAHLAYLAIRKKLKELDSQPIPTP